ncbi:hypothetical protein RQP46_007713 [Phenoliferia psychrophenolica]
MSAQQDYSEVKKAILGVLAQPGYDDGSAGPVLVRLAWHASGTYDLKTNTGGSDGAGMRYEMEGGDPANAGLQHARVFLEPIKAQFPWISYADLWTLAGVVAIEAMGGPVIPWKAGRTDFPDESKCPPNGRLPDASQASDHLRDVFYRMGFNDQEIVALSGAHSLGMLTKFEWTPKEWTGPFQYKNEDLGEELMMLPTDLALIEDASFRPHVEAYAGDSELFFSDFSKAFAKLIELGVERAERPYEVAPKKSDAPAKGAQADPRAVSLLSLPIELLALIGHQVAPEGGGAVAALRLTSSLLAKILQPILFKCIHVPADSEESDALLAALAWNVGGVKAALAFLEGALPTVSSIVLRWTKITARDANYDPLYELDPTTLPIKSLHFLGTPALFTTSPPTGHASSVFLELLNFIGRTGIEELSLRLRPTFVYDPLWATLSLPTLKRLELACQTSPDLSDVLNQATYNSLLSFLSSFPSLASLHLRGWLDQTGVEIALLTQAERAARSLCTTGLLAFLADSKVVELRFSFSEGYRDPSAKSHPHATERTTLLATAPVVSVLDNYNLERRCSYCFRSDSSVIKELSQCSLCKAVKYCSAVCQTTDWKAHHKEECKALIEAAKKNGGAVPDTPIRALGRLVRLKAKDPKGYLSTEVDALQSHRETLNAVQQEQYFQLSVSLAAFVGPEALSAAGYSSGSDMLDLCSRFASNSFALTTPHLSNVGVTISPLVALLNHSCFPNAVVVFPTRPSASSPSPAARKTMKVVAIRDIRQGEEVLTSYVDLALPKEERRAELLERYGFECGCEECESMEAVDPRTSSGDMTLDCKTCARRRSVDGDALRETIKLAGESLKAVQSIQFTSPKRATSLILAAVSSLTSLSLAPSSYPLLSLNQALFPLLLAQPPTFQPSPLSIASQINAGLEVLLPFPHPTKSIALASSAKLRVALLHPADEEAFWRDLVTVKSCIEELRRAAQAVESSFGMESGGVVAGELRELLSTLEEGMSRATGGV